MIDETEAIRRTMIETGQPYRDLEETPVHLRWDTQQMVKLFEVLSFWAPYVVVKRKADGAMGTLEFTHYPRFYFNFQSKED